MSSPLNWDELQTFTAVCRHGSVGAAARALQVNHSTVLRRLSALEQTLGVRLFDRLPGGYALTAHGHELAAGLDGVPEQIDSVQRRLLGGDLAIEGVVRLTSPEPLLPLLIPLLAELGAMHPRLQVQLVANSRFLNLTRREADVAVRGASRPPDNLIARPIGRLQSALYGSRRYLRSLGRQHGEDDYRWIAPDDTLAHLESAKWIRRHVADDRIALRVDNLPALVDAVDAGIGVGWLLCPLADGRRSLVRIAEPKPEFDTRLWVLSHPDLRQVARVRALVDFLVERLGSDPRLMATPRSAG